jgi:hypothetical protein
VARRRPADLLPLFIVESPRLRSAAAGRLRTRTAAAIAKMGMVGTSVRGGSYTLGPKTC